MIPKEVRDEIKRLRGKIIGKLRERKLLMVFLAMCEESTLIKIESGKIIIAFRNQMEYNYCNNPSALAALKEIFDEELHADFELSLVVYGDSSPNSVSNADILKLFSSADSIVFKNNTYRR